MAQFAHRSLLAAIALMLLAAGAARAASDYVTFDDLPVRPLALSADGSRLFAVNTPGNQLEIFSVGGAGQLTRSATVAVGVEPVSVAVRSATEVWVVNQLSDSVSVIDVGPGSPHVTRTLLVGDEPRDIVFAGAGGNRAFITTAHRGQNIGFDPQLTTPGVGRADVWVFDANNLGASLGGTPVTIVTLFGDTPRALAATPDGSTVYAAVFHSGNQTTTITEPAVCNGGSGAAPCTVSGLSMPGGLPAPNVNIDNVPGPETGLVVKFNPNTSHWEDRLGRNWDNGVRFNLPDEDVFAIDATANPPIETASFAHVGTVLFNMVVHPSNGRVYVTNTEARNEVRFEGPGGGGSTVRGHLHEARITVLDGANVLPRHLNKHINYAIAAPPASTKDASLATPMQAVLSATGSTLYVAAFGSNQVGVFDTAQLDADTFTPSAADHIAIPGGLPAGLALHDGHNRLYVLSRFDNSISAIDLATRVEAQRLALHNPEPYSVLTGRRFLYDAQLTSANGEASCASCHVSADNDDLAWDLGNPDDSVLVNLNAFRLGPFGNKDFHPLKGPMTTQTLRSMATHGPMHWRGDRSGANDPTVNDPFNEAAGFMRFNPAFVGLIGRSTQLTTTEMQAFSDFILQVKLPPNPNRNLDNSLTPDQQAASNFYFNTISDTVFACNGCHQLNPAAGFFGTDGRMTFEGETQHFKIAHLRNVYTKVGMFGMPTPQGGGNAHQGDQIRGFGVLHDGSVDTVFRFLNAAVFSFPSDVERRQMESFVFAYDTDFKPIVGQQITLTSTNAIAANPRIDLLLQRAAAGDCDVVVKGNIAGEPRGAYRLASGQFKTDRAAEATLGDAALRSVATTAGQELTYTAVPPGNGERIGIDRDSDGALDADELDAGTDPGSDLSLPMANLTCGTSNPLLDPVVHISRNDRTAGEQRLTLKGIISADIGSTIDPRANGLRFKFQDKDSNDLFYVAVGRGAPLVKNGPGWTVNTANTKWTYKDRFGSVGGITKIVLRRENNTNLYRLLVRGRDGNYQVASTALPLGVVTVLGGPDSGVDGECGSVLFNPSGGSSPTCRISTSGSTVTCS